MYNVISGRKNDELLSMNDGVIYLSFVSAIFIISTQSCTFGALLELQLIDPTATIRMIRTLWFKGDECTEQYSY